MHAAYSILLHYPQETRHHMAKGFAAELSAQVSLVLPLLDLQEIDGNVENSRSEDLTVDQNH